MEYDGNRPIRGIQSLPITELELATAGCLCGSQRSGMRSVVRQVAEACAILMWGGVQVYTARNDVLSL